MVALLNGGCATKKYVQKSLDPVNSKLGEVAQQANTQGQAQEQTAKSLDQTKKDLDDTKQAVAKNDSAINATNERAVAADNRAGDAMNRANEANQKTDKLATDVGDLKTAVQNIDDFKAVSSAAVYFKFNSDVLDDAAKQQLDQLVSVQNQYSRYFVTVKGFTDQTGSSQINDALSRRRAEAVVKYLVAEHNFPIQKLQLVGLGKSDLVDEANTRAARAKNRRVEVSLFSADARAREATPAR
jgi:outer membrane protein OmpA-like peptidoglycan-associated protein